MTDNTVTSFVATADLDTLDALESSIAARRTALIAGRNAALAEYPVLCPVGQPEHRIQVTRDAAIALLDAKTHVVAD
jgi:hypothetical protein